MQLRRAFTYAALGIGAAVVGNAALSKDAGDLPPALDGMQRTYRWRGMNVAYTEAGDPDDPTLVCLHGVNAAGSSGEFRAVFEDLAEDYHVVAPDLPGFGRSERPPLRYSAALYEDFVHDFLTEFETGDEADLSVLASSLTAAYVAGNLGDLAVSDLFLVCPTTRAGPEPPKEAVREFFRLPVVGELAFNALTSKPAIRYFNADHGYADPGVVDDEWTDYEWRTAHQANARFAPASFISGYLNADLDLAEALAGTDAEVTVFWGREADVSPLSQGRDLAETADVRLVVFDDAKLLPHVEWPAQFLAALRGEPPKTDSVVVESEELGEESEEREDEAPVDEADENGAAADDREVETDEE